MRQTELVSIIIPAFNRADTIERAVNSVLAQTWGNIEVIVVDDCSKDDTRERVQAIKDERLTLIALPKNSGGAVARNAGIDAAKGTAIALLDSDDYWDPLKLEKQMERAAASGSTHFVVYNKLVLVFNDSTLLAPERPLGEGERIDEYITVEKQYMQTSGLLVSGALARKVKFDVQLRKHQDIDYIIELSLQGAAFLFCEYPGVYFDNTSAVGRVSTSSDPTRTQTFLAKWDHYLSDRVKRFYMVSLVAPMQLRKTPVKALKVYAACLAKEPRLLKDVIDGALFYNAPPRVYEAVRSTFRAVSARKVQQLSVPVK